MRALALLLLLLPGAAAAQRFYTEAGTVTFTSRVPLHTFTGTSDRLVGLVDLDSSTVDFYVDLATLDTGIGKRDRDMRETLEVEAYPFAEFFGRLASPFDAADPAAQPVRVRGDFTLHGVTRPIEVEGTLQREDDGLRVRAAWTLRLDDYAIEPPSLLIVKVDEVQAIEIDALLRPQ